MSQREQNLAHVEVMVDQYLRCEISADDLYDRARLMDYLETEVDSIIANHKRFNAGEREEYQPTDRTELLYKMECQSHDIRLAQNLLEDAIRFIINSASAFAQLPLYFKKDISPYVVESYDNHRKEANELVTELAKRWNDSRKTKTQ